jgi:transcriptional regulator with XRE-family HTH domain
VFGLSLRDLAARSGVSAPILSQVERGETIPTIALAARIAVGFDVPLSQLLLLAAPASREELGGTAADRLDPLGLGPQFRALRERLGLSQLELARRADISAQMLSQIERDQVSPNLLVLERIAGGLDLTLVQLLQSEVALPPLDLRVCAVGNELIAALSANPALMYELHPRRLEELMAELYSREGFDVELTQQTRDDGVDLYLVRHTSFGRLLTLVDTKRYRADRPVGVGVVRQLYGVVEAKKASAGVVATTSFFSRDAQCFQERIPFRLALQDYRGLRSMLRHAVDTQQPSSAQNSTST